MKKDIKSRLPIYLIAIAIPLAVGALSALLTAKGMEIYGDMTKPPLAPPAFLFPIVWGILFVLMGISSAIVFEHRKLYPEDAASGLTHYTISLAVNFFWSIIFFNFEAYLIAFIWLIVLLYFVLRTFLDYRRISLTAALLQAPYILWIIYAGYLNFAIWFLNR